MSALTDAKRTALLKGLAHGLKQSIKGTKFYNCGSHATCKAEAAMAYDEFCELFASVGDVEPTNSRVVTKIFLNDEDVYQLFGSLLAEITTHPYSEPQNFRKQYKSKDRAAVHVEAALVNYSSNTNICKVKFEVDSDEVANYHAPGPMVFVMPGPGEPIQYSWASELGR